MTVGITGLCQVAQHVDDLDRASAFYSELLGVPPLATFDPPGLAFFDIGGTRLLLEKGAPAALLYLRVDSIHDTVDVLRGRDVSIESEPHVIHKDDDGLFGPPGEEEWMAFFRDSEGNLVGLASRQRSAP